MLSFNVAPIFKIRGIDNPYSYLVKKGISRHSATNILQGYNRVVRLDHLEKLCKILLCEPNDLFVWHPEKDEVYPDNHPLFNIRQQDSGDSIKETISTIPLKELREVTKTIIENRKAGK